MRNRVASLNWPSLKGDGAIVVFLALVCLVFFLPSLVAPGALIWPSSGLGSDIALRHWADFFNYVTSWQAGRLALWDSSTVVGRPLAGDPGVLFMYPLDVIFLFLPEATAFNALDALHVFLGGLFMFLFLRTGFEVERPAALLGGLAFAFAPKYMAHLAGGHINIICGLAWAPAVLLGLRQAIKGSLLAAALAGLALALQLPTHIQIPYYTAAVGSAFWLWHAAPPAWRALHGDRAAQKRVGWLALVYGVWLLAFALLAAFVLFPLLELLPYNSRAGFSLADANQFSLSPFMLTALLLAPPGITFHEYTVFVGVVPLTLGVLGWLSARQKEKWFFGGLAGFALIYALGTQTPLFSLVFWVVPGFRLLRIPTRMWLFGGLAVAVLAGLGAQALADEALCEKLGRWKGWLMRAAGVYGVVLAAAFVGYHFTLGQWYGLLLFQILTVALTAAASFGWLSGRLTGRVFRWLLVPLLLLDLWPTAAATLQLVSPEAAFLRPTAALDFVSKQPGVFRVYASSGELPTGLAAQRQVDVLESFLAFQIKPTTDAILEATGCVSTAYSTTVPPCIFDPTLLSRPDAEKLGRLNVRYLVSAAPPASPGFKEVLSGTPAVYENLLWQPRVQISPTGATGTVEIVRRLPGDYELRVEVDQPAQVTVSETWLPGWQATDNGQLLPLHPVDKNLIGLTLAPGAHRLHLAYDPLGWRLGWPVSLASFLALAAWCGWALLRQRASQAV